MTDQKLDPAAEARIREACPAAYHDEGCLYCRLQRAAILADREAREKCWTCGGSPNPSGLVCACGDTGSHSQEVQHLREQAIAKGDEEAHADALAEALRTALATLRYFYSSPTVAAQEMLDRFVTVLAAHDERRGSK